MLKLLYLGYASEYSKFLNFVKMSSDLKIISVINTDINYTLDTIFDNPYSEKIDSHLYKSENNIVYLISRLVLFFFPFRVIVKLFCSKIELPEKVDIVFSNWGLNGLINLAILKIMFPKTRAKFVLNVETFPTAWKDGLRTRLEIIILKKLWKYVDAVLIPTKEIETLFTDILGTIDIPVYRKPFFTNDMSEICSLYDKYRIDESKADMIFIGQIINDKSLNQVQELLKKIADQGVNIWYSSKNIIAHPNLHYFKPFTAEYLLNGVFDSFCKQFKCCLVAYNIDENKKGLRFDTSLPNRFIQPISLGLPIILEKGKYKAMENYLKDNETSYYLYSDINKIKANISKLKHSRNTEDLNIDLIRFLKSFK